MASIVAEKYSTLHSMMNEKLKRRWAGCKAMALGRGGISAVSQATGMSRTTIRKAIWEVEEVHPDLTDQITEGRSTIWHGTSTESTEQTTSRS